MGCEGCVYWRPISIAGMACHWALDNPPFCRLMSAKDCTYKLTKEESGMGKINEAEARQLYEAGKSDTEIAAVFGVTPSGVSFWRKSRGLVSNGRAKKQKEDKPVALKVPSIDALPAEIREKVEAAMAQKVAPDSQQLSPAVPEVPSEPQISLSVNPTSDRYDPLIYDAFDLAIAKTYEIGGQPGQVWRQLQAAVERHIQALAGYLEITEETMRCAVELAALAAVEEVRQ